MGKEILVLCLFLIFKFYEIVYIIIFNLIYIIGVLCGGVILLNIILWIVIYV